MIKNIVFDIGNVLITFQPEDYLRKTVADDALREKINQSIFLSPEWLLLDQGVISERQAVQIFQTRCPETESLINGSMDNLYAKLLHPMNENIAVLYEMKNLGYPVYLLSNYNEKAFEFIFKRNRFLHDVDGMILSYKVNLLKPAPEIFQCLLEQYDLLPEETVFIDDTANNVQAAKSLGIRGIHYKDHESFRSALNDLL
ncbi:MAG: HAD family phosphatase [Deltaproteobacteria bacterium]|nr:HAD family phosphatase [Deltaproteobacteria bacterium]